MRKLIYLIIPLVLLLSACGPEKTETDKTVTDSLAAKKDTVAAFKDPNAPPSDDYTGDHVVKDKTGNITLVRGFFRFGKRHGKWASFFPSGELQAETEYVNGKREGKSVVWYKNGKLMYEGVYTNDEKSGVWKFYTEDGKLSSEQKY